MGTITPRDARIRRHIRVRAKVEGRPERPRLCVFRSLNHIYAQVIDDYAGKTLAAASSAKLKQGGNLDAAKKVGLDVAKAAISAGVKKVVFDRGGFVYHGRVKALADAAREGGLDF